MKKFSSIVFTLAFIFGVGLVASCKIIDNNNDETTLDETGQQLGDAMASIDEVGGSTGSYAQLITGAQRTFARLEPRRFYQEPFFTDAFAGNCSTDITFGTCLSKTITRTFNGCAIGLTTLDGTVTLAYNNSDNDCQIDGTNETVSRTPNFTVTGLRGATLTVSKTGTNGQVVKRTGTNTFTFENDGIQREFKTAAGQSLFKFTTTTTSAIGITGSSRSDRVVNGGSLHVVDNLAGTTCDVVPNNITWTNTCNCAVSGNWAGTCSDGDSFALVLTGCGSATLSKGSNKQISVNFDRCY